MNYKFHEDCEHFQNFDEKGSPACSAGACVAFGCPDNCKKYKKKINVTSYNTTITDTEHSIQVKDAVRHRDMTMKELLKFTKFTGYLLTNILPELKGVTLDQFCEYTGGGQYLTEQATEMGSSNTKNVRLDLVFEYDARSEKLLRIDVEPQSTQKSYNEASLESYSLVARAFYYAALTLVTELREGDEYHKIRKAYSIWICYERPIPGIEEPIIRYNVKPEHEYHYTNGDSITTNHHKFDDGDLLSVVLISVPDIEKACEGKVRKIAQPYDSELLKDLRMMLSDNVVFEERKAFYKNHNILEGDDTMIDLESFAERYEKIVEKEKEEIKAEANKELLLTIIQMSIEDGRSDEKTIETISKKLKVDEETARQYYYKYYDEALQQED